MNNITETIDPELLDNNSSISVEILDQSEGTRLETSIQLKNPFDFDPTRFAPNDKTPTLDRFLDLTTQIISDAQKEIIAEKRVIMTDEYPAERFDRFGDEVISYRIISRKPANLSSDGKSRPQKGFGFAYHLRSPLYPDKVIIIDSRPIDHVVEFSCWSKRARLANQRALWLERLLINQIWAYQAQGFDRFIWEERLADTYYNVGGQTLYQRPLRFFVRLSEFRAKAETQISHMSLQIQPTM